MFEHDDKGLTRKTVERTDEVAKLREASLAIVLHTSDVDGVATTAYLVTLIDQDVPPCPGLAVDGGFKIPGLLVEVNIEIHGIVVIAQHGIDTVLGLQARQLGTEGLNLGWLLVLQVAGGRTSRYYCKNA